MPLPKRKSPRLKEYDYTSPGWYFITICTKDREHYFGEVHNKKMVLNALGAYCAQEIQNIKTRRKNVEIHEYIVMPNHVHILMIMNEFDKTENIWYKQKIDNCRDGLVGHPHHNENTHLDGRVTNASLQDQTIIHHNNYQWPLLWSIIGTLKWNITKYAKQKNIPFKRQPRYHDHIIRNETLYNNIKYYIQTNPEKWENDMFYI